MFGSLKNKLNEGVSKIVKTVSEKTIEEDDLEEVLWNFKMSLLKNDVAMNVSEKIIGNIKEDLIGREMKRSEIEEEIYRILESTLREIMQNSEGEINFEEEIAENKPYVILFLGFNGCGKTTSIAKMCKLLKDNGYSCVLAAGDTYRAASIEQLEKHGDNLGVKVISHDYGSDPAAIVFDSIKYAKSNNEDVVLVDTAGRSHKNTNLMEELSKVCRVNDIDEKILVLDSLTGNDAVEQAKEFENKIGVDGVILSKMDVNEKGGASISISHTIGKPIFYIGKGQEYDDLEKFRVEEILRKILEFD
ncbi:MAG: signal recognition particle-docking protein FtsY [Candidatus Aenigmatarchaeota archaeon]